MLITAHQLSRLRQARASIALPDARYLELLLQVGGVRDERHLDAEHFHRLIRELQLCGFHAPADWFDEEERVVRRGKAAPSQLARLRALWQGFTGSSDESGLGRWLQKHIGVSHPRYLDVGQAGTAIEILSRIGQRQTRPGEAPGTHKAQRPA